MSANDGASAPADGEPKDEYVRLEEFIFVRELYEVFLLLDHISGRWDKELKNPDDVIHKICKIGLTPATDPAGRLEQAVDLMRAKDMLNAVAQPATGLTVAFTILVVGEENRRRKTNAMRRLLRDLFKRDSPGNSVPAAARRGQGGALWDKPTRVTLARYAYPGLISVAIKFNRRIFLLVLCLLLTLALTCLLSWHVSAGNVVLEHLEIVRTRTATLRTEISAAELKYAADERTRLAADVAAPPVGPVIFCAFASPTEVAPRYRTTEEYQFCQRDKALREERRAVRENLRKWLAPWSAIYGPIYRAALAANPAVKPEPPGPPDPEGPNVRRRGTEEMARIVTLVVGTALLPLLYGVLGAGAAVVRRLWERMRESLLSPRDYTLALLQLALGGTIGACIGLFINPSGPAPAEDHGLLGAWALSGSALSFIAGFGVEGVFSALESLVNRVFRSSDAKRET